MTYKELEADEVVIEYGSIGDEFYVILEGECEVCIPDQRVDEIKQIIFEIKVLEDRL